MSSIQNAKPADDYKGLRVQFFALKRIIQSMEVQLAHYHKRVGSSNQGRIIELEAELESQKEMNALLTEELERINERLP